MQSLVWYLSAVWPKKHSRIDLVEFDLEIAIIEIG
jgi:hypothetical protein